MTDGVYSIVAFYAEDNTKTEETVVRMTRSAEPKPYVVVDLIQGQAPPAGVVDARQPIKHTIRNPFNKEQLESMKIGTQLWFCAADFAYRNKS